MKSTSLSNSVVLQPHFLILLGGGMFVARKESLKEKVNMYNVVNCFTINLVNLFGEFAIGKGFSLASCIQW